MPTALVSRRSRGWSYECVLPCAVALFKSDQNLFQLYSSVKLCWLFPALLAVLLGTDGWLDMTVVKCVPL